MFAKPRLYSFGGTLMTVTTVLALIALLLVLVSFFRSDWPLVTVAVLLLCIALLVPAFVH
jgi:hypothetical protein